MRVCLMLKKVHVRGRWYLPALFEARQIVAAFDGKMPPNLLSDRDILLN